MKRQLHLNLFIHSRGHHEASWRHPASSPLPLTDIRYYQDLAQRAEAGLFDSIFLADQLALGDDASQAARTWLEPVTVLAAMAVVDQPDRADRDRARPPIPSRSTWRASSARSTTSATAASAGTSSPRGSPPRPRNFGGDRPGQPRRPLRPRRGVHGRGQGAVGQLGRGCGDR